MRKNSIIQSFNHSIIQSSAILLLVLTFQFCEGNSFVRFHRGGTNTSSNNHWEQPSKPGLFAPEIVFVMDSSGSLGAERDSLILALSGWLEHLQDQGIKNFCLGVMGGYVGMRTGRYQAASGNPYCACTNDYDIAEIRYIFEKNLGELTSENASDGGEAYLYSLYQAVNNSDAISENRTHGCLLEDHVLVPIFLSDENEISAAVDGSEVNQTLDCSGDTVTIDSTTYNVDALAFDNSVFAAIDSTYTTTNPNSSKYNPVDTNCKEQSARFEFYSKHTPNGDGKYELNITPKKVADKLKKYNGILPTFGTGVGYKPGVDKFPHNDENGPMWGGIEFADIFGETIADLATATPDTQSIFNDQMKTVAEHLAQKVSFFYVFDLIDPVCLDHLDSLKVKVNGQTIDADDYELNEDRNRVTIDSAFDFNFNDTIDITYTSDC